VHGLRVQVLRKEQKREFGEGRGLKEWKPSSRIVAEFA